jgi:ADP-ribose pyrophosphatase
MTIRKLNSRVVYQNPWMVVREDEVERGNGDRGIYGVVEKFDSAIVIPIDQDQVFLVEQYRYPVGERSLEFPQGSLEQNGIDPAEIAREELKQETGLEAGSFEYLGQIFIAIGYANQKTHAFLARDLRKVGGAPDAEEQDLVVRKVSIEQLEQFIRDNRIKDAQTLAAWALYKVRGGA